MQGPQPMGSPRWFATWTASPSDAPARPLRDSIDRTPTLFDQTMRLIVRTSIGGDNVRIRVSNEYGDRPLVIGAAHVAVRTTGANIDGTTDKVLTFSGSPTLKLRPGGIAFSDPVAFAVPALKDIAISIHLADSARLSTRHALGPALARVLGREPDAPWAMLIDAAARRGHWPARRTQLLLAGDAPQDMPDVEAVLDALCDLVSELNELRTIGPVASP